MARQSKAKPSTATGEQNRRKFAAIVADAESEAAEVLSLTAAICGECEILPQHLKELQAIAGGVSRRVAELRTATDREDWATMALVAYRFGQHHQLLHQVYEQARWQFRLLHNSRLKTRAAHQGRKTNSAEWKSWVRAEYAAMLTAHSPKVARRLVQVAFPAKFEGKTIKATTVKRYVSKPRRTTR
jgi:hypothetical protein